MSFLPMFYGGLLMVLTSVIFPLLVITSLLFERLGKSTKKYKFNLFLFSVLTILLLTSYSLVIIDGEVWKDLVDANFQPVFLALGFVQLVFSSWLFISMFKKFENVYTKTWINVFSIIGIVMFSFSLTLSSFSGLGPILGQLMIMKVSSTESYSSIGYILPFSLGLILPFFILLRIISKKYVSLGGKKWWRILQFITIALLFLDSIFKVLT